MGEDGVRQHFIDCWYVESEELEKYDILAASGEIGGYEEWAWFLLRNREDGELFEVTGSCCSCHGFQDQFKPERTTHKYLLSDKFWGNGVDCDAFQEWFLEYADSRGELSLVDQPTS